MIAPEFIDANGHVFWVCLETGHLRHGRLMRVEGDIVFVQYQRDEVRGIAVLRLVKVPRFFGGHE